MQDAIGPLRKYYAKKDMSVYRADILFSARITYGHKAHPHIHFVQITRNGDDWYYEVRDKRNEDIVYIDVQDFSTRKACVEQITRDFNRGML